VHVVDFVIRIYHDSRLAERQVYPKGTCLYDQFRKLKSRQVILKRLSLSSQPSGVRSTLVDSVHLHCSCIYNEQSGVALLPLMAKCLPSFLVNNVVMHL